MNKKPYIKPVTIFEEIETGPLCDLSAHGSDMGWGDGSDTGRPREQSIFGDLGEEDQEADFVFNQDYD